MMKPEGKSGFTLVETVTVLAIIGVFITFFYMLFFLNWQACEGFLARSDFGQDMDQTVDQIANDGRYAREIDVSSNASAKQATFINADDSVISEYTMDDNGEMTVNRSGNQEILSEKLDFNNSNFAKDGDAVVVNIAMNDEIFAHTVTMNSETEIYPRNL